MSNYTPKDNSHLSLDEIEENEQKELAEKRKQQRRERFNIFNKTNLDGEGVSKDEIEIHENPNFKNFFKLLGRKSGQLLTVNLLFLMGIFPLIFILAASSGYFSISTTQPAFTVFAPLKGAAMFHDSSAVSALMTIFARQSEIRIFTTVDYVLFALGALVIFTFGPTRVGVTYILRNMFRCEPVFMWHDFWYAIKRNLRQAIIFGVIDLLISALIVYDIIFFNINYGLNLMMSIMFFTSLCFLVVYCLMRPYIYLMLVTFDISIFKMIKNAFLFTIIGIKRNIVVLLGTALTIFLEYILLSVYVPLGVLIPFIILPSFLMIMGIYGAYPVIKKIMIDPYYTKVSEPSEEL